MEWFGYRGRILRVDLARESWEIEDLGQEDARCYLGGAGLNAWLLFQMISPSTDPLGSDNPLIFGAGPLVGTKFPCGARTAFTALSPLTGIFGDANGGGFFGMMFKRAGFDHLVIEGKAPAPCYLLIQPGAACSLLPAEALWGQDVVETDRALLKRHPGSQVACIGPAGENRVLFANILSHEGGTSWSRTGLGAVMGSKNLKAIVVKGKGSIPVKDPEAFAALSASIRKEAQTGYGGRLFSRWGTMSQISMFSAMGLLYRKNGLERASLDQAERIGITEFHRLTEFEKQGCYGCPLKCEKRYRILEGPYEGEEGHKYELGYAATLGFNLGIDDLASVLHLTNRSNALGMDVVDLSSVLALAIELREKGLLADADLDGIALDWNAPGAVEEMMERIALQKGAGAILARGVRGAAGVFGSRAEPYALHFKGMSEPAHSSPPFALSFAVATRGGDHLKGMPILCVARPDRELVGRLFDGTENSLDLTSHEEKGRVIWWHENYKTVVDSLGTCFFLTSALTPMGRLLPGDLAEAYHLATGFETDADEILLAGERAYQVEKGVNRLMGIDRSNDTFGKRPEPGSWGYDIDLGHPGMLEEYYHFRGLDMEGRQTKDRLIDIGLAGIAERLQGYGLLGEAPANGHFPVLEKRLGPEEEPASTRERVRRAVKSRIMKLLHNPWVTNVLTSARIIRYQDRRTEKKTRASRNAVENSSKRAR